MSFWVIASSSITSTRGWLESGPAMYSGCALMSGEMPPEDVDQQPGVDRFGEELIGAEIAERFVFVLCIGVHRRQDDDAGLRRVAADAAGHFAPVELRHQR